jgi:PST family polysaccharide transporter
MVRFGAHLTVADFVARLSATSDNILIGRFFGAGSLGLYTRANVLVARPLLQVLTPIASVLVPVLSRLQSDSERYRRIFLRAYDTLALVVLPFAAMCLALARPLVLLILGPKWTDAIALFSAFALVAVSSPLSGIGGWIFESQGRGKDQLRNHTLAGAVTVGAFLAGLHWGPLGIILSLAVTSLIVRMPIIYYLMGRHGPVSTGDLWRGFLSHLPCWGVVYLATTLALMTVEHATPITQLLVCGPVSIAATAASICVFRRPRQSALYAWKVVKTSLVRHWSGTMKLPGV